MKILSLTVEFFPFVLAQLIHLSIMIYLLDVCDGDDDDIDNLEILRVEP